ncbi:tryptophan halogenase family protein [Sphingomonas lenta]|uniref:Tryptophan halogenase n=1 Tax=Sphingomonas lenta TaxID=1141887 RepID=A0A2A2SBP9_9SPHN|nr:tryptophan halogenase family protein [Sphingomonas lenta]PAX06610.1 tryptophan halogenase [Sphingomonas lenta]
MTDRSPSPPIRIVVLGGGTAGWMAACLFAHEWPQARVTVIESPDIGIIGVGEGSTPQLRALFAKLGIAEADWMPAANATYKVGIAFTGWSERPGYGRYFHPFASAVDLHTEPQFHASARARRTGRDVPAHPDRFFLNSRLAERGFVPLAPDNFPFEVGYGYHFDAHLVGQVLARRAAELGVEHRQDRVVEVAVGEDGQVSHLLTDGGEAIAGDLFVDASGFRSVIAQAALGGKFLPFASNLFNDRAVVMPTPNGDELNPYTTATALSAGWVWHIPLTSRAGNGYVYSSRYIDPDHAETELRRHLGTLDDPTPARHLEMKVGRVERSWTGNCLAIGLAQGFIEPLEATALHIVQATVEGFIQAYADGGFTPQHRDVFNRTIARRYEGIRDYIVCHYRLNRRTDTQYWRDAATLADLSDDLKAVMTCWFTGGDLPAEVHRLDIARYYAPMSWGCLLAGYGTFPADEKLRPAPPPADLASLDRLLDGCLLNFRSHAQALGSLRASA